MYCIDKNAFVPRQGNNINSLTNTQHIIIPRQGINISLRSESMINFAGINIWI